MLRIVPAKPPEKVPRRLCLACPSPPAIFIPRDPAQEMNAVMQLQSQAPDPVPPNLPELPPILPETPVPEPETEKPPILS